MAAPAALCLTFSRPWGGTQGARILLVLIVFGFVFLFLRWWPARCASDLVILNAADLSEQAVLELPLAIPYGLHGSWAAH